MDLLSKLQITGTLRVERDGDTLTLASDGRRVVVDVPSIAAARRLLTDALAARAALAKPTPNGRAAAADATDGAAGDGDGDERSKREALRDAARRVEQAGYTIELRIDGDRVVELGAGVEPNLIAKALSLGPVRLKARNLLGALLG